MALPRIEQKFGSFAHLRIIAEGDDCEVIYEGTPPFGRVVGRVNFQLSEVTRVMVSTRTGFLAHKHARTIHFLGHTGEVAKLTCSCLSAHTQAAATFVRHLIHEFKESERQRILESRHAERQRFQESKDAERHRLRELKQAEREKTRVREPQTVPPVTSRTAPVAGDHRPTPSQAPRGVPLSKAAMQEFERNLDRIRYPDRHDEKSVRDFRRTESQALRSESATKAEALKFEQNPDRIKVVDKRGRDATAARGVTPGEIRGQPGSPSTEGDILESDRSPDWIKVIDRRRRD